MSYYQIVEHYEQCFHTYGDTSKGVDWTNQTDANLRYQIMFDSIRNLNTQPISILDFGCGCGHFYEWIKKQGYTKNIQYSGLDISPIFCATIKHKFPEIDVYNMDILIENNYEKLPMFDYIIMNGVFTEKLKLEQTEMVNFMQKILEIMFTKTKKCIAWNIMTPLADWKRDDLFYFDFTLLSTYLKNKLSRNFIIRHDYGLWEYTVYLYKDSETFKHEPCECAGNPT